MRNTIKYILTGLSLFAAILTAGAQTWNESNGVATAKNVTGPDGDGAYTITLETYATGQEEVTMISAPADIVLVLDLSQSMTQNYGSVTSYRPRESQAYTYNNYGNSQYYYLHTDGNYYRVYRTRAGSNRDCQLYFDADTRYYLRGTTTTTTPPTDVDSNTGTIWTGVLYAQTTTNRTRLEALQGAVEDFLEVIYHNDNYEDKTDQHPRMVNGQPTPLGNRISIVTFGGPQGNTSVTKINSGLTDVTNADGSKNTSMINDLIALTNNGINNGDHYGTYADEGMNLADVVLSTIDAERKENSSRTVVLFTDGAPGSGPGWTTGNGATASTATANRTIGGPATSPSGALQAKTTYDATVFTVVLGDIANTTMGNYLDYTSSNYPNAESLSNPGQAGEGTAPVGGDTDYSLEAGNDLSGVFTTIAHASGGASATVGSKTQVRDVVSSSFEIPEGTTADDITIYTMDVTSDGLGWENPQTPSGVVPTITGNMLSVEGFDYSADENWVGPRTDNGISSYSGKKLVIEFKILANEGATGGVGTNTNTSASGVYVYDETTGTYSCINNYEIPHTTLPVNIRIKKSGLRSGESATFEIQRIRPKGYPDNIQYNQVTGKPLPDEDWEADPEEGGWETFSKVVVTNKSEVNGAAVIKSLLALDPNWVYKLLEDDWGWAYNMTGSGGSMTTSDVQENPFIFTNEEKTGVLKHAEAVTINHFQGTHTESSEEHYKSSKVEHF